MYLVVLNTVLANDGCGRIGESFSVEDLFRAQAHGPNHFFQGIDLLQPGDSAVLTCFRGSADNFGWSFPLMDAPAYLLINGFFGVVDCRRLRRGPPFPQRFGGASSVVEQRTRLAG
ncbi:MAG: hypothetical protein AUI93_06360 [Crenarchaeota archaeon 13_1_40CM_3_52_10]|nr:MAG: hypothetical protein AUI93_06360 [Crenarchaeota archaeon 13_1_40CM_3_52_10]